MSSQNTFIDHGAEPRTPFEKRWGISREELERRAAARVVEANKPSEKICEECGKRVTQLSDGREAGHKKGEREKEEQCSQFIGGDE